MTDELTHIHGRALITGATAGLGQEFAEQLAARGNDLILVARTPERLEATARDLASRHGVSIEVIAADLGNPHDLAIVEARLADATRPVTTLVNNAGYGLKAPFHENPVEKEAQHLAVLVAAPMRLMHAALGPMRARASGTIINVSSVAAYTPRGSYGAAKAWVLSFSRWANLEYRRDGVTVTAVVPGFVHTEFHDRMRVRTDTIPRVLWLDPPLVVRSTLRAADHGRAVVIPSMRYRMVVALTKVLPDRLTAAGSLHPR
ncbi:SDR family NAD(P)-dependent oxidoreductase [Salinibacterium hongtaonis]|uniref:KR domain-containing protein n=1 Tax=Homoserinimonas hongtaonis TaxID=2079791 RepID=A0A2U1SXN8_9MICO|nr:SDR family NAD(P)-dependent oxidoreductase [Salinibacterium hongtaonis]AWB90539.1 short-chain dehydrogenase [Salinibacterium hongtaonis]PWB96394.1 KR domain-containing protein [Salinibacterium hongtaonis]